MWHENRVMSNNSSTCSYDSEMTNLGIVHKVNVNKKIINYKICFFFLNKSLFYNSNNNNINKIICEVFIWIKFFQLLKIKDYK